MSRNVLFVCTANLCRSVTAEHVARQSALAAGVEWTFESVGLDVRADQALPPGVAGEMERLGISRGRARSIDEGAVTRAGLVLTAERVHRAEIVRAFPSAVVRTFTLLDFASHISHARRAAGSRTAATCDELREMAQLGRANGSRPEEIDIADPVRNGSATAMTDCFEIVSAAIASIVGGITPTSAEDDAAGPTEPRSAG